MSGAQTGTLDPMNDMFCTWNSGYVMAKFEGNSPSSSLVNNAFEYHIGGYSGRFSVLQTVTFHLTKQLEIKKDTISEMEINVEIKKWWKGNDLKIKDHPAITTPGMLSIGVSVNYKKMFSVSSIKNPCW